MPIRDYKFALNSAQAMKDASYSTDEVNFGVTNPNVGRGGKFGLHVLVTTTYTDLTEGGIIWIVHGAATTPTTKHIGRFFAAADLVAGKHYYIPGGHSLLQYARALFSKVTTDATLGNLTMWFGPDEDGAE